MRLKPPTRPAEPTQRLPAPTPAQIASVTDVLEHRWSSNALMMQDRLTQAIERDDHNAASKWSLGGAIATDKILVLQGRPTAYVGHVHAHRHELGPVFEKIASALRSPREVPVPLPDPHRVIITHSPLVALGTDDATQHGHVSPK